jgi:hypothetical protein
VKTLVLLAVIAATGCEYVEEVAGDISIAPALASPTAEVLVIADDVRPEPAAWSPIGARGELRIVDFVPGRLRYHYQANEIGGYRGALYLAAFLDLDGDRVLDPGEPSGTFAANPLLDVPGGTFDVDPAIADIAIHAP